MSMDKNVLMQEVEERIARCKACPLHTGRTNVVPGEGSLDSPIIFVGEGPGEEEDLTGRPFVGKAGRLLDKILESAGFKREDVYIANVVKCRPPGNRAPKPEEQRACSHFLLAQVAIIDPKVIVCLGGTAFSFFNGGNIPMKEARGKFFDWKAGIKLFAMYHPSYLLRVPSKASGSPKYQTWEDIRKLRKVYDALRSGKNIEEAIEESEI